MFAADLVRKVTVPCYITFIKVSSYEGLASRGNVTMKLPLNCDIEGRDVIIIDEIVETGLTVDYLFDYLAPMKPRSIAHYKISGHNHEREPVRGRLRSRL